MTDPQLPKICDYEGSNYRTDFWEGRGRNYEDRAERVALRRMLPESGKRLLEIGAGFGRLTEEYKGYDQVILLDYSFSQLQYARERYGDERFVYVAGDVYKLPFRAGIFDGATMIRVIHHMANVPSALREVRRVLAPEGIFILEHANKRNLKAILRYALKKQTWSPYDLAPVEFVELNFDFHPDYMQQALGVAGFVVQQRIPVSFFRLGLLKDNLPTGMLVALDSLLQRTGWLITPSVFIKSAAAGETPNNLTADSLFVCPEDGGKLVREGDTMLCQENGKRYAIRDGIYDFKAALE
ncbi:MAG: methyltransferase domain-containing protein [Chitinophagaceae bacterium]|nr:methyltransferase domain-containing protein [Anaerolineae bacterium]